MEHDGRPHTITDPDGKTEVRRLVDEKALHFSVLMAIRDCPAFSGTPKLGRDSAKRALADSVVKHFQVSDYRVFGVVAWNGPVGQRKHLWKTGAEVERKEACSSRPCRSKPKYPWPPTPCHPHRGNRNSPGNLIFGAANTVDGRRVQQPSRVVMIIALTVFGVLALVAIGYVAWGAILVGREYNAAERLTKARGRESVPPGSASDKLTLHIGPLRRHLAHSRASGRGYPATGLRGRPLPSQIG